MGYKVKHALQRRHKKKKKHHDDPPIVPDEPVIPEVDEDHVLAGIVFAFNYELFDTYKKDMLKYITTELSSYSKVFPDYESSKKVAMLNCTMQLSDLRF